MKNLFKAILAAVLGLSMLFAASVITVPALNKARNNAEYAPSLYYSDSLDRLPKHSLDAVFIGSSQIFSSVSPMEMWREQGVAGYCCTSAGQQPVASYYYLRAFLHRQTPQVVVVDVMGLYKDSILGSSEEESYNRSAVGRMPPCWEKVALAREIWKRQPNGESFYSYLLPILRYHARWKELQETDFTLRENYDYARGFDMVYGLNTLYPMTDADFPVLSEAPTDAQSERDEDAAGWYRRMAELCAARGIRLLLVKTPCINWTLEDRNTLLALAQECGVEAIDFNDPALWEQLGFDYGTDMIDHMHLNYRGARKLSVYLAEILRERYGLPDHRGEDSYAFWDSDLRMYDRQLKAWEIQHAATGTELRGLVLNGEYELLVVGMDKAENTFKEALGIQPEILDMWISRWDGERADTEFADTARGFFGGEEYEVDDTGIYMHGSNYMVGSGGLYYVVRDPILDRIVDYGTVHQNDALKRA